MGNKIVSDERAMVTDINAAARNDAVPPPSGTIELCRSRASVFALRMLGVNKRHYTAHLLNLSHPPLYHKFFLRIRRLLLRLTATFVVFGVGLIAATAQEAGLEGRLKSEGAAALAFAAREEGDAARGAITFHQPHTTCAKCHAVDGSPSGLGPDLTSLPKETADAELVES